MTIVKKNFMYKTKQKWNLIILDSSPQNKRESIQILEWVLSNDNVMDFIYIMYMNHFEKL